VELLIALLGAALMLSVLVLRAGYQRRGQAPLDYSPADVARAARARQLDASPSGNTWMFGGGGGLN
jgi:hypothetical protein